MPEYAPAFYPNALPPPVTVEATLRQTPSGDGWLAVIVCPYCGLEHTFESGRTGRAAQNVIRTPPCADAQQRRAGSRRVLVVIDEELIRQAIHARL